MRAAMHRAVMGLSALFLLIMGAMSRAIPPPPLVGLSSWSSDKRCTAAGCGLAPPCILHMIPPLSSATL